MEALIARAIQILIALGGAYILTLWFAIVVWTFQDIQSRSRSVVAQIFSTLVVLIFSIPGLLIYMILRPRYTLDDAFQRSLEEEYLMQDLEELPLCPGCQQYVEDDWVFCPNCRTELRDNCIACDQLIDLRWEICPFCGTEQYEDGDALPEPVVQPIMAPSPQFLGRPQLNQTEAFHLTERQEQTRPIIPATVRVDLWSGDIATEAVPELPLSSPLHRIGGLSEPRRVELDGNGYRDPEGQPGGTAADEVSTTDHVSSESEVDGLDGRANDSGGVEQAGVAPGSLDSSDSVADPNEQESAAVTLENPSEVSNPDPDDDASAPAKSSRKRRSRRKKSRANSAKDD
jgi:RNA polymerase subunit RPABC4/transcription elongation factor Spt4